MIAVKPGLQKTANTTLVDTQMTLSVSVEYCSLLLLEVDQVEMNQVEVDQVLVGQVLVDQVGVDQVEAGQVEVGQVEVSYLYTDHPDTVIDRLL